MVPSIANPVFAEAVTGIDKVARAAGLQILMATTSYDTTIEIATIRSLTELRVDGLIVTLADGSGDTAARLAAEADVPTVLMFNPGNSAAPSVSVDIAAAGGDVARALLTAGRRHIGYIAGRFTRRTGRARGSRAFARALPPQARRPRPCTRSAMMTVTFRRLSGLSWRARHGSMRCFVQTTCWPCR